ADRAFLRDNSLMLATSSQNQKRAESRAVIRLQRARWIKGRSTSFKSLLTDRSVNPSVTRSKVKVPASRIDAAMCAARVIMSAVTIKFSCVMDALMNDSEGEVSACHMCIDRNYAPHDLVNSHTELGQGNVQQRVVGAIQMQIAFVHFFSRCVEDLNAAN